jgi:hypothetical protein
VDDSATRKHAVTQAGSASFTYSYDANRDRYKQVYSAADSNDLVQGFTG